MPRNALLLLIAALPLAGCIPAQVTRIGVDYYRLQASYESRAELEEALANHARKADQLCPEGWRKRKDFDRVDGGSRVLVWEIACDAQFQPDNSRNRGTI